MSILFRSTLLLLGCSLILSCGSENDEEKCRSTEQNETFQDTTLDFTFFNGQQERHVQVFEITSNREQEIKGKYGTIVSFPSSCFGEVEGTVRVELIECYSIQDMFFNSISTQTKDGRLLESDGMIYLNASSENGDKLQIKNGKVNVKMPTGQLKKGVRIFEGEELDGRIVWNQSKEGLKINNTSGVNVTSNRQDISVSTLQLREKTFSMDSLLLTKSEGKPQVVIDKKIKNENLVGYIFQISKLGWINCDNYLEGETQKLLVNLDFGKENVICYLILDKYNTSLIPTRRSAINMQIEFLRVPVSEHFTLVALAANGDKIYLGMANYTKHEGEINCPELYPISRQELTNLLLDKFGKDIWNRPTL